jgi:hypothetical protein
MSFASRWMRWRTSALIKGLSLRARDTVGWDTPAALAISDMEVGRLWDMAFHPGVIIAIRWLRTSHPRIEVVAGTFVLRT